MACKSIKTIFDKQAFNVYISIKQYLECLTLVIPKFLITYCKDNNNNTLYDRHFFLNLFYLNLFNMKISAGYR